MIREAFDHLIHQPVIGLDIETTGLNHLTDKITSVQFGTYQKQFVLSLEEAKKIFEALRPLYVVHNAQFDLLFLEQNGVFINQVFDTMLAERVLHTGTYTRIGLGPTIKRHFGIDMKKDLQKKIAKMKITDRGFLEYAAEDVKHLVPLRESQIKELKKHDLMDVYRLELKFLRVLIYMKQSGFKLNPQKWREKLKNDKNDLDQAIQTLDEVARLHNLEPTRTVQTFFGTEEERIINWSSSDQVCDIFESLGIKVVHYDKKKKEYKRTVQEKYLRDQEHEIIKPYLYYQKVHKRITTYGLNYLEELSKYPDGRLRTDFKQIMNTGRISSGSGKVNFQNIPKVDEYRKRPIYERECFEPEEGNVFVVADYSSQESRILADQSEEPKLLEFYESGEADLHSFATKMVMADKYPEIKEMSLKEIKKKFPAERQIMKSFNFALA